MRHRAVATRGLTDTTTYGVVGHDEPMSLRVMTWNLWWRFGSWERRQEAIIRIIREIEPDVLCLQEAWAALNGDGIARILADELGYHATSSAPIGRDDIGFTNAVLSRWENSPIDDVALPGADGTPGHRRILAAAVDTPWGRWPVASTHLDHRFDASAARERQARCLLDCIAQWRGEPAIDLPVVVGADLNAVPDSDEARLLTGRRSGVDGVVCSDAWEHVGDDAGWTWRRDNPYTIDTAWPNRRIDYVLVSWPRPKPVGNPIAAFLAATRPVDLDGDAVWASDHAAVVVDLVTPS